MEIKDWDSLYSELRAIIKGFYFWQEESYFIELLSPDELLSFIKMRGI